MADERRRKAEARRDVAHRHGAVQARQHDAQPARIPHQAEHIRQFRRLAGAERRGICLFVRGVHLV